MTLKGKRFRLEIEGLRAIAALLVAIYHIWLNRVSGGVDVFFVISGFLITTSLFSMYNRTNGIQLFSYIINLLKRLMPSAWFIAIGTFVVSYLLAPAYTRPQFFTELIAALFYFENWRLAFDSVDYLAQNNEASPYQHYWALSIQFQFYLIWLLLFKIVLIMKSLFKKLDYEKIIFTILVVVVLVSLSYSVYFTNVNQPVAYYHTFTRVWEFGLGGIVAIVTRYIELPKRVAWIFGWVGLIGLLIGGIVFQVAIIFPGYAALWPTISAVLILLAGNTSKKFSAYTILASKPFVFFGKISYAFYLWHWPILIIFLLYFDKEIVSLKAGLAIIVLATILAYFTIYIVEMPLRKRKSSVMKSFVTIAIAMGLVGSVLWMYNEKVIPIEEIAIDHGVHPGVMAHKITNSPFYYDEETIIPDLDSGNPDMADVYDDGCFLTTGKVKLLECDYGAVTDYDYTIALVGGSHSAHWQPMLDEFGKANNVRVKTFLKANCRFSTQDTTDDNPDCVDWFELVTAHLLANPPNLIVTIGDVSGSDWIEIHEGFVEAWKIFEGANIPFFFIRDTPRFPYHIQECVRDSIDEGIDKCKFPRKDVIAEQNPLEQSKDLPSGSNIIDVTDYFCDDKYCYPAIGNIVVYFDSNHITASLAKTFVPFFEEPLMNALKESEQTR